MYPIVKVKDDRINSIERRHPWIFSRGVLFAGDCQDGDIVEVHSRQDKYLATGYYQNGSIMIRILSFEKRAIDAEFWREKIGRAQELRAQVGLPNENTDAYRLFHGEGDGAPGLIIDIYAHAAVIQCHTIGIHMAIAEISEALQSIMGASLTAIYDKSNNTLPDQYSHAMKDGFLLGEESDVIIKENGHQFRIDLVQGQKTGFFLDQRENRQLLSAYSKDKKVLNLYSYTGGFSIYALNSGASQVSSIDSSKTAIALLEENLLLNKHSDKHESLTEDVNRYLSQIESDQYDLIVVDPPAFAKNQRKKHNAVQAYKRVNRMAIEKVKSKGFIFTFSCSQVIDHQLFYDTITAAAIEAGRSCKVVHHLSQGPDHPVSIFHPEGKYLKGLVLAVD
jgi:23S rRNA (cytosine1962-C5)-methyltransferase